MESPQQRRDRRRAEKRQAIRMAAVKIALDAGIEAATVEAISAAADISPRTFFNYFASKEEALIMEPIWRPEELVDMLAERPADEPAFQSLKAVMRSLSVQVRPIWADMEPFVELRKRYPELTAKARAVDETKIMETIFEAVKGRPGVTSPIHARLLMVASFGATISAVQESLEAGGSVEELLDEAFTLLEKGL
ncbi:TetR/AcrR family transcriptional regulator [Nonomuraea sp. NPDC049784]|uniref:TetR/AcrR family transcriptional regulator n=1 Tax=Nonomuraea sp. NPDC049784 TaxID=3154361 RepID=UPI0033FAF5CC